jgi:hypothetical protein
VIGAVPELGGDLFVYVCVCVCVCVCFCLSACLLEKRKIPLLMVDWSGAWAMG